MPDRLNQIARTIKNRAPEIALGALVATGVAAVALIARNSEEEPKPNYLLEIDDECFEALKEPGSAHYWATETSNIFLQRKLPTE